MLKGEYGVARRLLEKALSIGETVLGRSHADVLYIQQQLKRAIKMESKRAKKAPPAAACRPLKGTTV